MHLIMQLKKSFQWILFETIISFILTGIFLSTLSGTVQIQNESNLPEASLIPAQNDFSNIDASEEPTSIAKHPQPAPSAYTNQSDRGTSTSIQKKKRETTGTRKMSCYEERCLELYKKKIYLQMKHQKKLHNIRKRWEEKIYKSKYDLLKNKHCDDVEQ